MLHVQFFDIQAHKGKKLLLGGYKYHSVERRQREHREASHGSWPKLTRDIMHMRKKREIKQAVKCMRGNQFLLRQPLFLSIPPSCSRGVKTANFLIKAVCCVIKHEMWLRRCWENDVFVNACLHTRTACASFSAAVARCSLGRQSGRDQYPTEALLVAKGHGWETNPLTFRHGSSWSPADPSSPSSTSPLNVSNDSNEKQKVKYSQ